MTIKYYTRFVSREGFGPATNLEEAFTEKRIQNWIVSRIQNSGQQCIIQYVRALGNFTRYLFDSNRLSQNPINNIIDIYPKRGISGVVKALCAPNPQASLKQLIKQPRYQSYLAQRLWDFIKWKRLMGCKYTTAEIALADFDRFWAREGTHASILTQEHLNRYAASCERIKPSTLRYRLGLVRQFCIYLKRVEPESVVPDRYWCRIRTPKFHPFILSPEDLKRIIEATKILCKNSRWPLRADSFCTVLLLLYSTGLRLGEALHLAVKDVDLDNSILIIRQTKFNKSRLVPIAPSMTKELKRYACLRDEFFGEQEPESAFFRSIYKRAFCLGTIEEIFRKAIHLAGFNTVAERRPPRPHDLRHSFAVERLLQWYRQGADVQNKLPLLSTYMGHVNVASTQVYLTVTAELLEEVNHRFEAYAGKLITHEKGETDELY